MNFIGVDPGFDGCVAVVDNAGTLLRTTRTPLISSATARGRPEYDVRAMYSLLLTELNIAGGNPTHSVRFVLERIHNMPGEGGTSSFRFGAGWGLWMGIATGMGLPIIEITPQDWQRVALRGHPMKNPKATAYLVATRLWPNMNAVDARHGGADAALMADAARRLTRAREERVGHSAT